MNCFVGHAVGESQLDTCKWLTIEEIKEVPMPVPMLKIWQAYIERGN
jgi:A/G-specific adenine glycosylase